MADKYFGDWACQRKALKSIFQTAGNARSTVIFFNSEFENEEARKKAGRVA
jgi:hypothetical protein